GPLPGAGAGPGAKPAAQRVVRRRPTRVGSLLAGAAWAALHREPALWASSALVKDIPPACLLNMAKVTMPSRAPRSLKMVVGFPARAERGTMHPSWLAARSVVSWCRAPEPTDDPDPPRHHGMSPAACGQQSTQGRVCMVGYPASHRPRRES